jgi:hypothetical protein
MRTMVGDEFLEVGQQGHRSSLSTDPERPRDESKDDEDEKYLEVGGGSTNSIRATEVNP